MKILETIISPSVLRGYKALMVSTTKRKIWKRVLLKCLRRVRALRVSVLDHYSLNIKEGEVASCGPDTRKEWAKEELTKRLVHVAPSLETKTEAR